MRSAVCTAVLALSILGCANAPNFDKAEENIIDGELCGADEHPEAVAIIYELTVKGTGGGGEFKLPASPGCTGTLIAEDVVLTAAHCIDDGYFEQELRRYGMELVRQDFYVAFERELKVIEGGLGPGGVELPEDAIKVSQTLQQQSFNINVLPFGTIDMSKPSNWFDIGLMYLDEVAEGRPVATVLSPDEAEMIDVDIPVQMVGWGASEDPWKSTTGQVPSGTKYCGESAISDLSAFEIVTGRSGEARKCHGDSGGPTFVTLEDGDKHIVGVASRLATQDGCTGHVIETRADAWYDWINEELDKACADELRPSCLPVVEPDPTLGPDAGIGMPAEMGTPSAGRDDSCRVGSDPTPIIWLSAVGLLLGVRRR